LGGDDRTAGTLLALYILFGVKIADQWEKAVVLRFGKFTGLRGP
jgi:regulator of protease activity HflC (stomatin/prohibitin superfamily)